MRLPAIEKPIAMGYVADGHCFARGWLRIVIFSDDHEPAHVHVFGDGHAKINLQPDTLELLWTLTRSEARKAMKIVAKYRESLLETWRELHG
ncbi:MAG: DUF4160 domain-containing protein [Mesorhizobium sp.]